MAMFGCWFCVSFVLCSPSEMAVVCRVPHILARFFECPCGSEYPTGGVTESWVACGLRVLRVLGGLALHK